MNIEKKLRLAARCVTPNVLGKLPCQEETKKRRRRLSDRAVQMIATAASIALLICAGLGGAAYFRDRYGWPSFQSGNTTLTNPIDTTGTPTNPTETQKPTEDTVPPTTDPVETTQPTEPMPTDPLPTDPPEPISDEKYDSRPDSVYIGIHGPDSQSSYDRYDLNASECVEGWLYVFDKETGEPTLICDEPVALYDVNSEHIYYVTKQNPHTVVRADMDGQNQITYELGITITRIDYFGGADGFLGLVDNYTDVVIYNFSEGTKTVIYSHYDIQSVSFAGYKRGGVIEVYTYHGDWGYNTITGDIWELL